LVQALYLHFMNPNLSLFARLSLLGLATIPWLVRDFFPVNKFSDNYTKIDEKSTWLIRAMYRVKKYQYVFYKHFLLHGLNISIALRGHNLSTDKLFRFYWLLLNTAYVMEFFMQTLVKKGYMLQNTMLVMQHILMAASSLVAIGALRNVNLLVAFISLILNFANRKHDVVNTAATACICLISFELLLPL
jgi:hypothetical protein